MVIRHPRILACAFSLLLVATCCAQSPANPEATGPSEAEYFTIETLPLPEEARIEVAGIATYATRSLLVATRRGQIWLLDDAYAPEPEWKLWFEGLQEPLGLQVEGREVVCIQRGELSSLRDSDSDGRADQLTTLSDAWPLSGNYHEYAFGPVRDRSGRFWVTLNKPFGAQPFGRVPWRGWAVRIEADGSIRGVCAGLRSPCGLGRAPWGDLFYSDNQGEWCGASKLAQLSIGDFHGHPHGIDSCTDPASLVEHPGEIPNGIPMPAAAAQIPNFKMPAIWFPYDKMGRSPSGFVWDTSKGAFGPFSGQLFIGDQYAASVMRCDLEQVRGHWQGACFPFRSGFASGLIRLHMGSGGVLFTGASDRGWGSRGTARQGLQRLRWTGRTPFEILSMRATPNGFRLTFTQPLDAASARPESVAMKSYTYSLHAAYGSPEIDTRALEVPRVKLADDGLVLDVRVEGLREGFVHELRAAGLRSREGLPLLHPDAYYTLIHRPH